MATIQPLPTGCPAEGSGAAVDDEVVTLRRTLLAQSARHCSGIWRVSLRPRMESAHPRRPQCGLNALGVLRSEIAAGSPSGSVEGHDGALGLVLAAGE